MANMQLTKTPMPEQAPAVRAHNFQEVAQGYTEDMAVNEAQRCLNCKNMPCVAACPVGVRIPNFIDRVKARDFDGAYALLREDNSLPAICGRVCPQETQCESKCVRGIKGEPVGIGRLERYVADRAMSAGAPQTRARADAENRRRVAVVGSGPAGLSCAGALNRMGYDVTIFEALHTPGGVLVYGIPEFRLPKALVREEIQKLTDAGVTIIKNAVIGQSISLRELLDTEGFEAVFVGSGAGLPRFQNIPGESLCGVYSANEFLTRINLMKAYDFPRHLTPVLVGETAAVVGGGNVAMDAARCALRMGAKSVKIVYRRGEDEMPARREEIEHAKQEGVEFLLLTNPVSLEGDENGFVKRMRVIKMALGKPDASGRRRPVEVPGSEYDIEADTVVIAIGNAPNPLIARTTPGLETQKWGGIVANEETLATSIPGVYAGGDIVTGAATVILAMGAGKRAAKEIDLYLQRKTR